MLAEAALSAIRTRGIGPKDEARFVVRCIGATTTGERSAFARSDALCLEWARARGLTRSPLVFRVGGYSVCTTAPRDAAIRCVENLLGFKATEREAGLRGLRALGDARCPAGTVLHKTEGRCLPVRGRRFYGVGSGGRGVRYVVEVYDEDEGWFPVGDFFDRADAEQTAAEMRREGSAVRILRSTALSGAGSRGRRRAG